LSLATLAQTTAPTEVAMFRFDPFSPEIDADPFPAYRRLREEFPCFWSEEADAWILSRFADIVVALNDWPRYSSAKGNNVAELPNRAGATLGATDPPRHDQLRALLQHAFVKRSLDSLTGQIRDMAREAAEALRGRKRFDFIGDFCGAFTVRVLSAALGLPPGDEEIVRRNAIMMVQTDPVIRAKGPQHVAAFEWMKAYAATVIAERRARPQNDLISHFAQATIEGDRLSERELLMTTTTLIMAGVESLGGFMSMFGLNLADFPDVRRALVADPALLPDAIEESLRYNTSAQRFRRCLTQDVELHGQRMRAGDFVCLAFGSGNRDDRQYPNAEIYDLARKPRGHLGFGGGTHACLGATIARLSTAIAIDEFHKVVPAYHRVDDKLPWMPSATFRSPLRLPLEAARA
jgi:cytochrome P450